MTAPRGAAAPKIQPAVPRTAIAQQMRQARQCGVVRADPLPPSSYRIDTPPGGGLGVHVVRGVLFFGDLHGLKFCPRKPLNTTQQIGAAL